MHKNLLRKYAIASQVEAADLYSYAQRALARKDHAAAILFQTWSAAEYKRAQDAVTRLQLSNHK